MYSQFINPDEVPLKCVTEDEIIYTRTVKLG